MLFFSIYTWENWNWEKWNNLPKVTLLLSRRIRILLGSLAHKVFSYTLCCSSPNTPVFYYLIIKQSEIVFEKFFHVMTQKSHLKKKKNPSVKYRIFFWLNSRHYFKMFISCLINLFSTWPKILIHIYLWFFGILVEYVSASTQKGKVTMD